MPATTFRYFRDPHHFSTYTQEPRTCDVCGRTPPGYEGPFYSEEDLDFVCESCLASGRLAEQDATTNSADTRTLYWQIKIANPHLSEEQIETLVNDKTAELEQRTPHIVTWQDFEWPAHCQDYAAFVKEAGKPDLTALSPVGDGRFFLNEHLYHGLTTDLDHLWSSVRPDSPTSNDTSYSTAIYLFQCLHCNDYTILWDTD
jgi:uncharacterized protein CbrC (UPF0167 family)